MSPQAWSFHAGKRTADSHEKMSAGPFTCRLYAGLLIWELSAGANEMRLSHT
jgi:hypothetical protein